MKKKSQFFLLLLVVFAFLFFRLYKKQKTATLPTLNTIKDAPKTKPRINSIEPIFVKPITPELFKAFNSQTLEERQAFIKANLNNYELNKQEFTWLKLRIADKKLYIVNRNDMASIIVNQRRKNPELYRLFVEFYEDPEETFQWREYAVQFLGQSLPSAGENKDRVHSKLIEIAREDKTLIAGTAMMQLVQQEGFGNIELDFRFDDLLDKHLKSETISTSIKMSLIGCIGKRKDVERLPLVRDILKTTPHNNMKRTSIATIGLLGDRNDIDLIKPYMQDDNKLVVMATKAAIVRLEKL